MENKFAYYSVILVICAALAGSAYNGFFLLLTREFHPFLFFLHLFAALVSAAALFRIAAHPFVKIFLSLLLSVFLVFANVNIMQVPVEQYQKQSEDLKAAFTQCAWSTSYYFRDKGTLPSDINELARFDKKVLNYPDPFSDGKQPLGFVRLSEKKFLLYSIGPDGIDDKGILRLAADFNYNAYRFPWQVMFLGEVMRNAVMPPARESFRGDIVEEREVIPLPVKSRK